MNPNRYSILVLGAALGLLAGCASESRSHVVSAPPPASPTTTSQVVVTPQPAQQVVMTVAPAGAPQSYVVLQAPPALPAPQAITAQPSSSHVWIDGYWTWRNNRYEWMAAHWEVPPFSGAKWEYPRTESQSGAFRFYEGRWI